MAFEIECSQVALRRFILALYALCASVFLPATASFAEENSQASQCSSADVFVVARPKLYYDGYYVQVREPHGASYREVLRFYPDGSIVGASIDRTSWGGKDDDGFYRSLTNWLKIPLPNERDFSEEYMVGKFNVQGTSIKLNKGKVDYWGRIKNGSLILDCHSRINDYRSSGEEFVFHPIVKRSIEAKVSNESIER
ncbi:MAG: hypothetical protein K2X77_00200 [Candidatus Obscuribacterales bacterium]|nr:hypothetical protein [Candidatus Obscuribacterales bacterium]